MKKELSKEEQKRQQQEQAGLEALRKKQQEIIQLEKEKASVAKSMNEELKRLTLDRLDFFDWETQQELQKLKDRFGEESDIIDKFNQIRAIKREKLANEIAAAAEREKEKELQIQQQLIKKREKELQKHLEHMRKQWDDMYDKVFDITADTFTSLFQGTEDGWKNVIENMKNWFFKLLGQMAAQAIAQPILVPIVNQIMGHNRAGAATGGGLGSLLGMTGESGNGGFGLSSLSQLSNIGRWGYNTLFGSGETAAGGTAVTAASTGEASGQGFMSSITGTQMAGTGGSLTLGSAMGYGALGSLGYTYLGGMLGLPQGEYSGITAGVGGALGSWGGSALGAALSSTAAGAAGTAAGATAGAEIGSAWPVVGTIIGAIIGGLAGTLIPGNKHRTPRVAIGGQTLMSAAEDREKLIDFTQGISFTQHADEYGAQVNESLIKAAEASMVPYRALYKMLDEETQNDVYEKIQERIEDQSKLIHAFVMKADRPAQVFDMVVKQWLKEMPEKIDDLISDIFVNVLPAFGSQYLDEIQNIGFLDTTEWEEQIAEINADIENLSDTSVGTIQGYFDKLNAIWEQVQMYIQASSQLMQDSLAQAFRTDGTVAEQWTAFSQNIRNSLYNSVLDGMISALMQSEMFQQALAPTIKGIEDALSASWEGGIFDPEKFNEMMTPAIAAMESNLVMIEPVFEAIANQMAGLKELFGISTNTADGYNETQSQQTQQSQQIQQLSDQQITATIESTAILTDIRNAIDQKEMVVNVGVTVPVRVVTVDGEVLKEEIIEQVFEEIKDKVEAEEIVINSQAA